MILMHYSVPGSLEWWGETPLDTLHVLESSAQCDRDDMFWTGCNIQITPAYPEDYSSRNSLSMYCQRCLMVEEDWRQEYEEEKQEWRMICRA